MTFTLFGFKLIEAVGAIVILWPLFLLLHWIDGRPPHISEFEAGGITAVVILRLIEAMHAYGKQT